ncbi:MAG: hypothetical protein ACREOK_08155 [Gemmatimonadaceae bacterium]
MTSSTGAQELASTRRAFARPIDTAFAAPSDLFPEEPERSGVGEMLAAGAGAGLVGIVGGAYVGASLEQCGPDEWFCGLAGGIIGGAVGSTIMIPVGVHLASRRHSSFAAKLGVSAAVMGVTALLAYPTSGVSILVMPLGQLIATVSVENNASRRATAGH